MGQTDEIEKELTTKQRRFCEEYIVDWNATQAAIRAGYSENTAKEIGCQNLTKLNLKKYIDKCKDKATELAGVSALQNALWLKEIVEDFEQDPRVRIKAIEVLNKMAGHDAPIKQEVSVKQEVKNRPEWFDDE